MPIDEPLITALALERAVQDHRGRVRRRRNDLRKSEASARRERRPRFRYLTEPRRAGARADATPTNAPSSSRVADMGRRRHPRSRTTDWSRASASCSSTTAGVHANLLRWLEPGGRFAFAVLGSSVRKPWLTTVRDVVARIVDLPQPDPNAPGPFRYANSDTLLALLDGAGFAKLEVRQWRGPLRVGGGLLPAPEAARFALASFSSFGELLAKAGHEAMSEAQRALTARFIDDHKAGVVQLDGCVHVFTGARP